MSFLVGETEVLGYRLAESEHAPRLLPQEGIERLHRLEAELKGTIQVLAEGLVEPVELAVLGIEPGELGSQALVHRDGLRVQGVVMGNQLVTLDRVLDRDEQFFAQPRLDNEAIDFALVDGINHRVQAKNSRNQNAHAVRLDFPRLSEEFQAGQRRHLLIAQNH